MWNGKRRIVNCPNLNTEQVAMLEIISEQNWHAHEISEQLPFGDNQLQMQLLELELQDRVSRTASGSYRTLGPQ